MRRRAFTLMETLVAIVLLLALSGAVMSFFWNSLERRDTLLALSGEVRAGTLLLERLEADFLTAVAADGKGGAGIAGDRTSVRVVSRGVRPTLNGGSAAGSLGDEKGLAVRFEEATGRVSLRRWSGEDPGGGSDEVVAEGVSALRLRYFDGRSWRDSFDSKSAGDLPVAVEVALWFRRPGDPAPRPAVEERRVAAVEDEEAEWEAEDDPFAMPASFDDAAAWEDEIVPSDLPEREPDRVRVIIVPDGPSAAWRESR
ncbi:MAG: prepilin-type N-terminal cleavage/methylation domain-containing protein [Phycisphaeraceae bacterium]|nr:prepilin-type N-terminal cleavage/methylation domain-containing protein [Phycisphaeraceae bacterium]